MWEKIPKRKILDSWNSLLEMVFGAFSLPMSLVVEFGERGLLEKSTKVLLFTSLGGGLGPCKIGHITLGIGVKTI